MNEKIKEGETIANRDIVETCRKKEHACIDSLQALTVMLSWEGSSTGLYTQCVRAAIMQK